MNQLNNHSFTLPRLFGTILLLSASTFGGGFVIVSLLKKKVVEELKWLKEEEMLDLTAIAQSAPGSIQVNASSLLGYRLAGAVGAVVAIVAAILPPLILLSLIACFYDFFRSIPMLSRMLLVMRAGVAAVVVDVVINLAKKILAQRQPLYSLLMILIFVLGYFFKVSSIWLILICLGIGLIRILWGLHHPDVDKEV